MSTATPLTRTSPTTAPSPAVDNARPAAPVGLADLLAEVGTVVEALPGDRIDALSAPLAALTAHLVDGARVAGASVGFTPSRDTSSTLSLRTLGRLAAGTAGSTYPVDAVRAQRVRDLTARLAA